MALRLTGLAALSTAAVALHGFNNHVGAAAPCVAPGTCTPPAAAYSRVIPGPTPGQQWNTAGGAWWDAPS